MEKPIEQMTPNEALAEADTFGTWATKQVFAIAGLMVGTVALLVSGKTTEPTTTIASVTIVLLSLGTGRLCDAIARHLDALREVHRHG